MSKSLIVYHGPSMYDQRDIVAILQPGSTNSKTGNMAQLWILSADVNPIEASRTGSDYSICGNCPHRGKANPAKTSGWADKRSCYVNLIQAPTAIYNAFKRGAYQQAQSIEQVKTMLSGAGLRLGAYGDPAALPADLVTMLASFASFTTGYTHAHTVPYAVSPSECMLSVESKEDAQSAHAIGKRTFRVIPIAQANDPLLANEILCPSTKGVQCSDCKLCAGQGIKAKSIAIVAHGTGKGNI